MSEKDSVADCCSFDADFCRLSVRHYNLVKKKKKKKKRRRRERKEEEEGGAGGEEE